MVLWLVFGCGGFPPDDVVERLQAGEQACYACAGATGEDRAPCIARAEENLQTELDAYTSSWRGRFTDFDRLSGYAFVATNRDVALQLRAVQ